MRRQSFLNIAIQSTATMKFSIDWLYIKRKQKQVRYLKNFIVHPCLNSGLNKNILYS